MIWPDIHTGSLWWEKPSTAWDPSRPSSKEITFKMTTWHTAACSRTTEWMPLRADPTLIPLIRRTFPCFLQ
jgi:hypothetical protein